MIKSWNFVDHWSSIIWLKDTCNLGGSSSRLFSSFINSNFNLIATFNKLSLLGGVFYEIQCTFIALLAFDKYDMSSKIMVTMFSLFAELERDLISARTKEALASKKAQGIKLGKPKGTIQKSKFDVLLIVFNFYF